MVTLSGHTTTIIVLKIIAEQAGNNFYLYTHMQENNMTPVSHVQKCIARVCKHILIKHYGWALNAMFAYMLTDDGCP